MILSFVVYFELKKMTKTLHKKAITKAQLTIIIIGLFMSIAPITSVTGYANITAISQELPVPREETVVFEAMASGYFTNYEKFNPFIPNGAQWAAGWGLICAEKNIIPDIAKGVWNMLRVTGYEFSADYKELTIHIRHGVHWNDGVAFTSKDWNFTINLMINRTDVFGKTIKNLIKSIAIPDDYTVVLQFNNPSPRAAYDLLASWGGQSNTILYIAPEHIWKDKNITTYTNNPPVETGPYKLYGVYSERQMFVWQYDPNYWGIAVLNRTF
jgi:ABC-type transport system substrate-binding protein